MKHLKRSLSFIIVLCMVLTMLPTTAWAADGVSISSSDYIMVENYGHFDYTMDDLVWGEDNVLYSPDGCPMFIAVTAPLEYWLGGNSLADYVEAYGEYYFNMTCWEDLLALTDENGFALLTAQAYEMLAITTATNPNWDETDGTCLHYYLYVGLGEDYASSIGEGLSWTLEDGVLTITGEGTMRSFAAAAAPWAEQAEAITEVRVQAATNISAYAFSGCANLISATLGDGVTEIAEYAFADTALESIMIPASVTYIDIFAFLGCADFYEYEVSADNKHYSSLDGVLYNKDQTELIKAPTTIDWVNVPDTVTTIGDYAFAYCTLLESVEFPESVTEMGSYAFAWCTSLTAQDLPVNITSVPYGTFHKCSNLQRVGMPDGITEIQDAAFNYCTSLLDIRLPDGLESIGYLAFQKCDSLTEVILPDSLTYIDNYAFNMCGGLTEITIPASVEHIGQSAFYGCTALESVWFLGDAPEFGSGVFQFAVFDGYYTAEAEGWTSEVLFALSPYAQWHYYDADANLVAHDFSDVVIEAGYYENYTNFAFDMSRLILLLDGQYYYKSNGMPVYIGVWNEEGLGYLNGFTLLETIEEHGEEVFDFTYLEALVLETNEDGYAPLTEDTWFYLEQILTATGNWKKTELENYLFVKESYIVETKPEPEPSSPDDYLKYEGAYLVGLDYLFQQELDDLDRRYDGYGYIDEYYIIARMRSHFIGKYNYNYFDVFTVSAEEYEAALFKYFVVDEQMLAAVRENLEYDEENQTYTLYFGGGTGGGAIYSRFYRGFVENGNVFEIYYEDRNIVYLYDQFESSDDYWAFVESVSTWNEEEEYWERPWEIEYNGVLYNFHYDEGYYTFGTWTGTGNKYTMEFVDGILRLVSSGTFSDDEAADVYSEPLYKISGVRNAFGSILGLMFYAMPMAPNEEFDALLAEQYSVTGVDYMAFQLAATAEGYDVQPNGSFTVSFLLPEGYNSNAQVFFLEEWGLAKVEATYDETTGYFSVSTDRLGIFVLANSAFDTSVDASEIQSSDYDFLLDTFGYRIIFGAEYMLLSSNGVYYAQAGQPLFINLYRTLEWLEGSSLYNWAVNYECLDTEVWMAMTSIMDEDGYILLTENTLLMLIDLLSKFDQADFYYYLLFAGVNADELDYTCGNDLTWSFADGVLTISGTGEMDSYYEKFPWAPYQDQIHTLVVEEGVTSIAFRAFEGYSNLASVSFPETLALIDEQAFWNCDSLTEIYIPAGVTNIEYWAFAKCDNITAFTVSEDNAYYCSVDGVLYSKDMTVLYQCPGTFSGAFKIPEGVEAVDDYAFNNCTGLTGVIMPDSVTYLGSSAFEDCFALEEVRLSENLEYISYWAFANCWSLQSITIPNSVTEISSYAFFSCSALQEVILSRSLTAIYESAFAHCQALTSIGMPDSVTYLGVYAFYGCTELADVTLSENLQEIDYGAFEDCWALTSITIPDGVTGLYSTFSDCTGLEEVILPANLEWIGEFTFYKCESLKSIVMPNTVTYIDTNAFYQCYALEDVVWSENLESIGYGAFAQCFALKSIELHDTLTYIDDYAFYRCETVTEVTIPESVEYIGTYAFRRCDSLTDVIFLGNAPKFGEDAFMDVTATVVYPAGNETWTEDVRQSYGGTLTWVNSENAEDPGEDTPTYDFWYEGTCGENVYWGLTGDGTMVIYGEGEMDYYYVYYDEDWSSDDRPYKSRRFDIKSVIVERGVTNVSQYAFYGCTNLTSVTLKEGVTVIGSDAFAHCTSLQEVILSDTVLEIYGYAFGGCTALSNVTLSNSLTAIYGGAFDDCPLTEITLPETLTTIGSFAFANCDFTTVYIPASVSNLDINAFYGNKNMTAYVVSEDNQTYASVNGILCNKEKTHVLRAPVGFVGAFTAPDTVVYIDENAFYECLGLTDVVLGNVSNIGTSAFEYSGLTSVVLSDNLTTINSWAFRYCQNLQSVVIPDSVTWIGYVAFGYCTSLKSITFGTGLTSVPYFVCRDCTSLTEVTLTDKMTYVDAGAFTHCDSLKSITLPESIKSIYSNAFAYSGLESIVIPDSVTTIHSEAFGGCESLKSIVIGSGVTTIKTVAFHTCTNLQEVYFTGNAPTEFSPYAFQDTTTTAYYPMNNTTWTEDVLLDYDGDITWIGRYDVLEGGNCTINGDAGQQLVIRADAEVTRFSHVTVNGETVDPKYYTITEGSTIITFSAEYISSLPAGQHEIVMHFDDGAVSKTNVTIEREEKEPVGTITSGNWTMALDSVIYLNYYPTLNGFADDFDFGTRGGVIIWTGDEDALFAYKGAARDLMQIGKDNCQVIAGMQQNENGEWYVQSNEIFAKNLGDTVYIRVFVEVNGEYVYGGVNYYSAANYCYDILNNREEREDTRNVCAALLQYAAAAQIYFDYKTDALVTDIPSNWPNIDLSQYNLAYDEAYIDELPTTSNVDQHIKDLAASLSGTRVSVTHLPDTLDLQGAIRLTVRYSMEKVNIDWSNVASAKVLFWNEDAMADLDALTVENANYIGDLIFDEAEGVYKAQSDHILAKNLGEVVYFSVRIEMNDGTVYRGGLNWYSPEAFVADSIAAESGAIEVCKAIAVYSEMARIRFSQ